MSSGRDTMCTMAARCVGGLIVRHFSGLIEERREETPVSTKDSGDWVMHTWGGRRWEIERYCCCLKESSALAPSPETAKENDFFLPYQMALYLRSQTQLISIANGSALVPCIRISLFMQDMLSTLQAND